MDDYSWALFQDMAYHQFKRVALGVMTLAKKNSNLDAFNVVLNELVTPLFYQSFSLTCPAGTNSTLIIPTLKVPRCLDCRNANPINLLKLTKNPPPWYRQNLSASCYSKNHKISCYTHQRQGVLFVFARIHTNPSYWFWFLRGSLLHKNPVWMKTFSMLGHIP